jgi:hypothetical protein
MELRKELVSTIMEMMFPKYSNWVTIKWKKEAFFWSTALLTATAATNACIALPQVGII